MFPFRLTIRYALLLAAALCAEVALAQTGAETDPLTILGFRASTGAAAGYVADKACATCHAALYQSYQEVGMARSFARPQQAAPIEDFGKEYYHEPSKRYYQIRKEGDNLIFKRYNRDAAGKPINLFETPIDWVMGSGNRARSYLYQTEWGELFMLPLGWYSEGKEWAMSPGFEQENHPGLQRQVKRECMFCHNAFAEVPSGSDEHWQAHRFPKDLPQGTGCQRCHGPGAEHIRAALTGATPEKIRAQIVNPRKLEPELRDSVCFQCHMLPAVTIIGSRRFDRLDYSFRPGQRLSEYLVHVEVEDQNEARADRFEINHHGYRFWQSRCYQESKGELACISCHDPHVKPTSTAFRAKVSGVCLGCHQDPVHQPGFQAGGDCVSCHMPTRRTRDVVHVTMTDHRIARGPFNASDLVKPLTQQDPIITDLNLLPWGHPPQGDEGELYRIIATMRALSQKNSTQALQRQLSRAEFPSPVPYLELAKAETNLRDYAAAEATAKFLLKRDPDFAPAFGLLGLAQFGQDDLAAAIASLERSLALQPTPEVHYNLALAAFKARKPEMALEHLDKSLAMRPNQPRAWMYQGRVNASLGRLPAAREALIRALELDPGHGPIYVDLVRLLRHMGKDDEAERYLAVGQRVAREPEILDSLKPAE